MCEHGQFRWEIKEDTECLWSRIVCFDGDRLHKTICEFICYYYILVVEYYVSKGFEDLCYGIMRVGLVLEEAHVYFIWNTSCFISYAGSNFYRCAFGSLIAKFRVNYKVASPYHH